MQYLPSRIAAGLLVVLITLLNGAQRADAADYRLRAGDVLRVEVLEDSSLNGTALVAPDGRISVPLAGSLGAAGHTVEEVRQALTGALAGNFAVPPTVHVGLASVAEPAARRAALPYKVYILGEVASPGLVEVPPGTTLLQVLSLAGGFSDFAATKRIQLRRLPTSGSGERVWTFNYEAMLEGRSSAATTRLNEGDVIVVPARRLFE